MARVLNDPSDLNGEDPLLLQAERAWCRALAGRRFDEPAGPEDRAFLQGLARNDPGDGPEA